MSTLHKLVFTVSFLLLGSGLSSGSAQTLTLESWQSGQNDLDQWSTIIAAFNEDHPDIQVAFEPTSFDLYDDVLADKLAQGTAGDLITCRPFDVSLEQYNQGYLQSLNDLAGLDNYSDFAKSGWTTDNGAVTYCLPLASVMHGFLYNKAIFDDLGLEPPRTYEDLLRTLASIQEDGRYYPLLLGSDGLPTLSETLFDPIGVNFWGGEEGRRALIGGSESFLSEDFVSAFNAVAELKPYLVDGYESVSESQVWPLFMGGFGAVAPAGSWVLSWVPEYSPFEIGAFAPPPLAGEGCYISDHIDMGIGINAASPNAEAAETFLNWLSGEDFAQLYANAYKGFFPLSNHSITIEDPLANAFISWRDECDSSIRLTSQILRRGTPDVEETLRSALQDMLVGKISSDEAALQVQASLASWYAPQQ